MIRVDGHHGEFIVLNGAFVSKFRENGKDEAVKSPAGTFERCTIEVMKRNGDDERAYAVLLAMSLFMSLTIGESDETDLRRLVAELEVIRTANERSLPIADACRPSRDAKQRARLRPGHHVSDNPSERQHPLAARFGQRDELPLGEVELPEFFDKRSRLA